MQRVKELRWDCDADALLALVEPAGPACHTGERTCFHNGGLEPAPGEALAALERTIAQRRAERPEGSYTAELLADPGRIGEKVREEADEVARAAAEEADERVAEEAADVLYHLAVLLASRGLSFTDAFEELNAPLRQAVAAGLPPRIRRHLESLLLNEISTVVADDVATLELSPSLDEVRELARDHTLVPLRHTFIADCETPVSAYLKLRGGGPVVPARVGRAGAARGALVVPRLPARGR